MIEKLSKNDFAIEVYKSANAYIQNAVNFLFLMNGGACVALLAQIEKLPRAETRTALEYFCLGLIAAFLASFFSYFLQRRYFVSSCKAADFQEFVADHTMSAGRACLIFTISGGAGCFVFGVLKSTSLLR